MTDRFEATVSASLLRLRAQTPFFATLALFARIEASSQVSTAATDGRDIWINAEYLRRLSSSQVDGLLLHEVLHAALLHVSRRGVREPLLWNFAADIVVNGVIANQTPFALPPGALREKSLEAFSVEEIYELLQRDAKRPPSRCVCDLLNAPPGTDAAFDGPDSERRRLLEAYWQHAREQAVFIAAASRRGDLPGGLARELGQLEPSRLPWRDLLWRFLVRTPSDFQNFDRRFLGRGLYLEALEGESVRVWACIDTSGSISNAQMNAFSSEIIGILRAYPHLQCDLYFADAELHGPFRPDADAPIPAPIGGGGTDFRPFFKAVAREETLGEGVCVYVTDGYGTFPSEPPALPVLWVVTSGGLDLKAFPWGQTARLLND